MLFDQWLTQSNAPNEEMAASCTKCARLRQALPTLRPKEVYQRTLRHTWALGTSTRCAESRDIANRSEDLIVDAISRVRMR
jgi:hypothetical protein